MVKNRKPQLSLLLDTTKRQINNNIQCAYVLKNNTKRNLLEKICSENRLYRHNIILNYCNFYYTKHLTVLILLRFVLFQNDRHRLIRGT